MLIQKHLAKLGEQALDSLIQMLVNHRQLYLAPFSIQPLVQGPVCITWFH